MKINYNNTALGLIDNPDNFYFGFPDPEITPSYSRGELLNFAYSLRDKASKSLKELCGNNIQYVCHSFWEAYTKGRHKLKDVFDKEEVEEGGVLILPGQGITHTYYYYVNASVIDGVWGYDMLFIDFNKRNTKEHQDGPAMDVYISVSRDRDEPKMVSHNSIIWNGYINSGKVSQWWEAMILTFVLFKKYCDIETKVIEGGKRGTVAGNKYVNETNKRVNILDCTWFTNLVRTGAFMVGDETGGFLRWQPWGPNNSQRKLIWVSPFEKEGYNRKAKMLSNDTGKDN